MGKLMPHGAPSADELKLTKGLGLDPLANVEHASEGDELKQTIGLLNPTGLAPEAFPMEETMWVVMGAVDECACDCGCFSLELSLLALEAEEGACEEGEEGGESRLTTSRRAEGYKRACAC